MGHLYHGKLLVITRGYSINYLLKFPIEIVDLLIKNGHFLLVITRGYCQIFLQFSDFTHPINAPAVVDASVDRSLRPLGAVITCRPWQKVLGKAVENMVGSKRQALRLTMQWVENGI